MKALVPAIEEFPLGDGRDRDEDHSYAWNVFVRRILQLLLGTVEDLGRSRLSWIVQWSMDGIESTSVFNILQYKSPLRTMNDIPPIDLHPDEGLEEVPAIMD